MNKMLRMRCQYCGNWDRVPVIKIYVESSSSEPKVKVFIPMYEPLNVFRCSKCGKIIAEPKELIRIIKK